MVDLSLHILDVVENAVRANASKIEIILNKNLSQKKMYLKIIDNGKGMDKETCAKLLDPFFTTKQDKKVGLGLSLLLQAAEQTGGALNVDSAHEEGTTVNAIFNYEHIDMKPIGDIIETMKTLIVSNPEIQFILKYNDGEEKIYFDSKKQ